MSRLPDRNEKRQHHISLLGIESSSTLQQSFRSSASKRNPAMQSILDGQRQFQKLKSSPSLFRRTDVAQNDSQRSNLDDGLMRAKPRLPSVIGNMYRQQNRSDLSLPGAFRMKASGQIDDDPSIVSASTRGTTTLYIPNASLVLDPSSYERGMRAAQTEQTEEVSVLVARAENGLIITTRQIRLLCLLLGLIVISIVVGVIVAVNERSKETVALRISHNGGADSKIALAWSDDVEEDMVEETDVLSNLPTMFPTYLIKAIQQDTRTPSPTVRITNNPSIAPSSLPSLQPTFPTSDSPTISPSAAASDVPTLLTSNRPSIAPTVLTTRAAETTSPTLITLVASPLPSNLRVHNMPSRIESPSSSVAPTSSSRPSFSSTNEESTEVTYEDTTDAGFGSP